MNKFLIAAAASVGLASPALALDTHAAWQGYAVVTANTTACAGVGGAAVGSISTSIYRAGLTSTDPSAISFVYLRGAINLTNNSETANPQMRGSGANTVRTSTGRALSYTYTSTFTNVVTSPATIVEATYNVILTGTFNNFWNVTGCNVTFKGTYLKEQF